MMVKRSKKKVTKMLGEPVGTRNKIKRVYIYVCVSDIIFFACAVPAGINIPEITGLAQLASFQTKPFLC